MTREFDLSKTWNKYAIDTKIVKEYSPAELLCATVLWMPWPLSNVNLVIEAVGADLLNHMGGFFVAFHSPKDHKVWTGKQRKVGRHYDMYICCCTACLKLQ